MQITSRILFFIIFLSFYLIKSILTIKFWINRLNRNTPFCIKHAINLHRERACCSKHLCKRILRNGIQWKLCIISLVELGFAWIVEKFLISIEWIDRWYMLCKKTSATEMGNNPRLLVGVCGSLKPILYLVIILRSRTSPVYFLDLGNTLLNTKTLLKMNN